MKLTDKQKQYIIENYSTTKNTELLKNLPNITNKQMVNFATRKGLRKKQDFRGVLFKTKFSPQQDQLIKQLYPKAPKEKLLELIPYSWETIVRRAAVLKIKRDLSYIHTKNYLKSGISVNDFATNHKIPLSTAGQIFNEHGEDFLREYAKDPYINRLELRVKKLFENDIKIEKWNKHPTEGDIPYRPDFRLTENNKVVYLNIDGIFYHTEDRVGKDYHYKLQRAFNDKHVRLLQFRSEELDDSPEIIKSITLNCFQKGEKIRASKCTVENISQKEAFKFLKSNHLMGKTQNRPTKGLIYNNQIVAVLCYSIHCEVLEIDRFCTKVGTIVYGGFSKLLNKVVQETNCCAIRSFCDKRYSTGVSYEKLGFTLESETPSWRWANRVRTYHRLSCRANMDQRGPSQREYAEELGYKKIYDAGQAKYIKVLDNERYRKIPNKVSKTEYTPKRVFWTVEQKNLLKELSEKQLTRSEIIKQFQKLYPNKTKASIIRKLFDLGLTRKKQVLSCLPTKS